MAKEKAGNDLVTVKGTVYWAFLTKVNDMSGSYQVDIGQLSDKAVKALEAIGITANFKDEQGFYVTCKSKNTIRAYDTDHDEIHDIIGNGSKCLAKIGAYDWTFKNKKGTSASLKSFVITDLVAYEGAAADIDEEEAL